MKIPKKQWEEWASIAIDTAKKTGADFADVRIMKIRRQVIFARNERIARIDDSESVGFGVRCLAKGAWGYAASSALNSDNIKQIAQRAALMAKAASITKDTPVIIADEPAQVADWTTPRSIDPFDVPLEEKTNLLLNATLTMKKVDEIRLATAFIHQIKHHQLYVSTDGSSIFRDRVITDGRIDANAVGNDDKQSRTYHVTGKHAGWEHIINGDLAGNAPRVASEAREKLFADKGPVGKIDLILDPEHLYLTMHESIGHATELDRVLGYEADYAGTSFATTDKMGNFQYGSKIVNAVADNTNPEYLATTGFDDEGVEGQKWDIIREGVLVDYGTSRETAPQIGSKRSHGTCRSDGWWNSPIVRIPNLGILPNKGTPEELIADTKDGIFISDSGTWSIDQQRLNFQFGGDMFWRIKNGKKAGLLKNVVYQSSTPVFWNACDAICGPEDWRAIGVLNCGKGQPAQTGYMSHYSATSRFRQIDVLRGEE